MRLIPLDSLRGICALMVVLLHTPIESHFFYSTIVRNSHIFVDYFFVLSGFVITLAYGTKVYSTSTFAQFLIKRVGRLWPLHAFILLLMLFILLAKYFAKQAGLFSFGDDPFNTELMIYFVRDLFFLNGLQSEQRYWLNFPSWSINAEFWAYVTFGLICAFRLPKTIAILISIIATGTVLFGLYDPGIGSAWGGGAFRAIFFFGIGFLTHEIYTKLNKDTLKFGNAIEVGVLLAVLLLMLFYKYLPLNTLISGLIFSVTILVYSLSSGVISRFLSTKTLKTIGDRSYSIYLIHILVLQIIGLCLRFAEKALDIDLYVKSDKAQSSVELLNFGNLWVMDMMALLLLVLVVFLSGFTYKYIELPGQRVTAKIITNMRMPAKNRSATTPQQ